MKAAAAAVLLGLFCTAACASSAGPANSGQSPSRSVPVSAGTQGSTAKGQRVYLAAVRSGTDYSYSGDSLVRYEDLACSWFAGGADLVFVDQNLDMRVRDDGGRSSDIVTIVVSAVTNLCPRYQGKLRNDH